MTEVTLKLEASPEEYEAALDEARDPYSYTSRRSQDLLEELYLAFRLLK